MSSGEHAWPEAFLTKADVQGVYASAAAFEALIARLDALLLALAGEDARWSLHMPPVMSRTTFEKAGYYRNFPHLSGTVHAFDGGERDHREALSVMDRGEDWSAGHASTDVVLTPASCYPVYPLIAARGPLPPEGAALTVTSYCFRREPSDDPARMQSFRMREFIRAGTPGQVEAFRERWMEAAGRLARMLGLEARLEIAHDPFFGRVGVIKNKGQLTQKLKYELLAKTAPEGGYNACGSFNLHLGHFAEAFGLAASDGSEVHSGCVGFGLERLALAATAAHGVEPEAWPEALRPGFLPDSITET